MNISELIEKLEEFDSELLVIVNGMEGGYNNVTTLSEKTIAINSEAGWGWWYGKHGDAEDADVKFERREAIRLG